MPTAINFLHSALRTPHSAIPLAVLRSGELLVPYFLLEWGLTAATRLPEAAYSEGALVAALGRHLAAPAPASLLVLALSGAGLVAALRSRSLGPGWADFEHGRRLRLFVGLVAFVLAWAYGTYAYNFYFDRGHDLDRLLLLALAPLLVWRPVFVFPFLLVLFPILHQFGEPIRGYSWAEQILLIRILFLFAALWLVRLLGRRQRSADFVFLACCLVAAHYWVPGLGKLEFRLDWILHDRVYYLLPATYANGWLGFLDPETLSALTRALAAFNAPMKLMTLLVECGALFCLRSRTTLRAFLPAAIALNLGIFAASGICFWKWMVLDAGLLLVFFGRRGPELPVFTRPHFLLSLVLIGGAGLWFRPVKLAWHDARVSYTYRFEARGESGGRYALPPGYFAPYDYQFTLGHFAYLSREPHLGIVWGATSREIAAALDRSASPEEVRALEGRLGRAAFRPERSAAFDAFVGRFVGNRNARLGEAHWWRLLPAPPQLWTFGRGPRPAERLAEVTLFQVVSFYDGRRYREIRKTRLRAFTPAAAGSPARRRSGTD